MRISDVKLYLCLFQAFFLSTQCSSQSKLADAIYPPATVDVKFHSDQTKGHYRNRIREFKNNPLKISDIVFLGNSITENGGDWSKRLGIPYIRNRGISGDVTDGVLNRLGEIWYFKPKMVFLMIGVNDVSNPYISVAYAYNNILKIVSTIHTHSPNTQIYLHTILPTSNLLIRNKIKELNSLIREKPINYILLDMYGLFADGNDLIKSEFTIDGIHLSEAGYKVWVQFLKKHFDLR